MIVKYHPIERLLFHQLLTSLVFEIVINFFIFYLTVSILVEAFSSNFQLPSMGCQLIKYFSITYFNFIFIINYTSGILFLSKQQKGQRIMQKDEVLGTKL